MMTYAEVTVAVVSAVVFTGLIGLILHNQARSRWKKEQVIKEWEEKMKK